MKIALAQINTTIGDFQGNLAKILDYLRRSGQNKADLVVFPELTLTGYPPKDLLDRPDFVEANQRALRDLTREVGETACLVGFVEARSENTGKPLSNAVALIQNKKIIGVKRKHLLPTYDVFDEGRYFEPGNDSPVFSIRNCALGVSICEDLWNDPDYWGRCPYNHDPVAELAKAGAQVFINLSASPFSRNKRSIRRKILSKQAKKFSTPLVYVNLVGGNDDLVFDGASVVFDARGRRVYQAPSFQEHLGYIELDRLPSPTTISDPKELTQVLDALGLGLGDYMEKCGFSRVLVGLSGGIDSALTAWIATQVLGPQSVLGVSMPSPYSSEGSVRDARRLAEALGIEFRVYPISELYYDYLKILHEDASGKIDTPLQNIQARIRGNLLMALSNREGRLLLSTGNKSEMSVGYCTLYGDMAGGFAVLSDVPKTLVYKLSREANRRFPAIPKSTLTKAPSAELAPGQKDQDELPDYAILDDIIESYVEKQLTPREILAKGYSKKVVFDVLRRLDANEYKRSQAAPGIRITSKAFGYGRRVPLSSRYRIQF